MNDNESFSPMRYHVRAKISGTSFDIVPILDGVFCPPREKLGDLGPLVA